MKKIFDFIIGICIWAALGYGVYYYFNHSDPESRIFTQDDFEAPLSTYKTTDKADREGLVTALRLANNGSAEDQEHFINCMGDFAENKLQTLSISKVFGWCVLESKNNRERFTGHFNELDTLDEPRHAVSACEAIIEAGLLAPASAMHPSGGQDYIDHGKGKYTIVTYVDAQNAFGAMIRNNYRCVVQYTGPDAPWHPSAWKALEVHYID